jgi:uncharacterized membrane protein required for colicin V production
LWRDRAIGILLGLILGIVAVVLFVFLGSQDVIDAPSIDQPPPAERPAERDDR